MRTPRNARSGRRLAARAAVVLACLALGASRGVAGGGRPAPSPPPAAPPPDAPAGPQVPTRERVSIPTADGAKLAATYASQGAAPGAPAVVLVHGEGQTRGAFGLLFDALDEHRVPWLAIDLRGHGESSTQAGVDLSAAARARDPAFHATLDEDVWGAIRWLVDVRRHDAARIGVLAAGLGAAAASKCAHLHKGALCALMLMTPSNTFPGLDPERDLGDVDGNMDFTVLSSVEDDKKLPKVGPLHLLFIVQRARNAPKDTPRDERIKRRRGIPPHWRAFAETNIPGTAMIAGVAHFDAWLAAWWARRLGTYPHPVLYDGSVDLKGDYADPEWAFGTELAAGGGLVAHALRWGRRVMVGGELPPDARTVFLRVQIRRGEHAQAGQYAQIAYPSGTVTAQPLVAGFMGRSEPTETSALVLQPEEIPQEDGSIEYGKPSFEAEIRLPELHAESGPYTVRVSWAVERTGAGRAEGPGVDPDAPETWTTIPDLFDPTPARPPTPGGR